MNAQNVSLESLDLSTSRFPLMSNLSLSEPTAVGPSAFFLNASDGNQVQDGDQLPAMTTIVSVVLLSLLIVITFLGNIWVALVILTRPHLRGALANIFTVSLCCVDLLASTVTMPLSLVTLAGGQHVLSDQVNLPSVNRSGPTRNAGMVQTFQWEAV